MPAHPDVPKPPTMTCSPDTPVPPHRHPRVPWHSLAFLGSPSPMLTVSVLPPALRAATSPCPLTKVTLRVPPPPQPSFFTRNCSLGEREAMRLRGGDAVLFCHLSRPPSLRVLEGEAQLGAGELLVALAQEADQLRLEDGLQEIVGIVLVEDEEIILPGAGGGTPARGCQRGQGWCPSVLGGNRETRLGLGPPRVNLGAI